MTYNENQRLCAGFVFLRMVTNMKSILISLLVLISGAAQAAQLAVERGFEVHTINGQEVEDSAKNEYVLKTGENQIVFSFSGNLSTGTSTELLDTKPYILTLGVDGSSTIEIELISRKHKRVASAIDKESPWFVVYDQDKEVEDYQLALLPAKKGFFPYADIPALVASYNKDNKIYFSEGKLVDYEELEKVTNSNFIKLQSLYLDASPEERKQFRKWIIDIE